MNKPQRIVHDTKPGSLLKRTGMPRPSEATAGAAGQPQQPRSKDGDADYKGHIRQLPCLHCGMEPSEAAHVRMASAAFGKASGLGKKPADKFCVPLCSEHHRLGRDAQHNRGEKEFWDSLGINPLICAEQLYAARDDPAAMRMIVVLTIATRNKS